MCFNGECVIERLSWTIHPHHWCPCVPCCRQKNFPPPPLMNRAARFQAPSWPWRVSHNLPFSRGLLLGPVESAHIPNKIPKTMMGIQTMCGWQPFMHLTVTNLGGLIGTFAEVCDGFGKTCDPLKCLLTGERLLLFQLKCMLDWLELTLELVHFHLGCKQVILELSVIVRQLTHCGRQRVCARQFLPR
jgi:hypothetical protein